MASGAKALPLEVAELFGMVVRQRHSLELGPNCASLMLELVLITCDFHEARLAAQSISWVCLV